MSVLDDATVVLNDDQWAQVREEAAQNFLGMGAEEFVERYQRGEFEGENEPDLLMDVLAFFPELD